ncbi:hypothetical protein NV379_06300 [Paenibacillus sp. N1-5-1-14]|uniref:hypothetical protein n=1 Tax=Paenibacillus radicibacter TaxID=2972488 RepID=UPI002158E6DB|nr:hypothetical protein [Paenibacillus radicibacter]MCR8642267.1 hypothetical protein [Paenibacillus radicibacter]
MNLADMLTYADIQDLNRIASTYDCECNSHSKNDLIQSILSTVNRKDVFEQQIADLSLEEVRFLNSLLFDTKALFSLEELTARARQAKFEKEDSDNFNPRDLIVRFKKLGWLFHGHSPQTKYLFQVPNDLKKRFCDVLGRRMLERLQWTKDPVVYREEHRLIVEDIHKFLKFVGSNDVILAADGTIYKRTLAAALEELSVREANVSKGGWRFGYGRMFKDYPNRFSLIYDYCYFHALIRETDGRLQLTDIGTERILLNQKELIQDVYKFWLRLYKGPIPNLEALVQWMERLTKDWVDVSSLKEVLCPLISPFYYDQAESIFDFRLTQMMLHLGLLSIGETEQGKQVVRLSRVGSFIIRGIQVKDDEVIKWPNHISDPR